MKGERKIFQMANRICILFLGFSLNNIRFIVKKSVFYMQQKRAKQAQMPTIFFAQCAEPDDGGAAGG